MCLPNSCCHWVFSSAVFVMFLGSCGILGTGAGLSQSYSDQNVKLIITHQHLEAGCWGELGGKHVQMAVMLSHECMCSLHVRCLSPGLGGKGMKQRYSVSFVYKLRGHFPLCWGQMTGIGNMLCVMFLSVQEFMTFTSQLIVERSAKGSRASVKEQGKRTYQWQMYWPSCCLSGDPTPLPACTLFPLLPVYTKLCPPAMGV